MDSYPQNYWTDEDIDKLKNNYFMATETNCPICRRKVVIEKQEGETYLKKKYIDTHFFLDFECKGCGRKAIRTYKKSG